VFSRIQFDGPANALRKDAGHTTQRLKDVHILIYEEFMSLRKDLDEKSNEIDTLADSPKIPRELLGFVERDSFSLLIKGSAGTGKTTLALTIVRGLIRGGKLLYLSTRISPAQMFKDHPWLWGSLGSREAPVNERATSEIKVPPEFVDARLDEPSPLFERITSELMDVRSPIIVLDSWNSLEESMEQEELRMNMKVLQTWRERVSAKLILVGEDSNDPTLDSLVDGVVVLSHGELETRRARELLLSKLHGTNISNPRYFFTLNNGAFRSFEHYTREELRVDGLISRFYPRRKQPRFRPGDHAPTGYPALDAVLGGGLQVGAVVTLDLDPQVDPRLAMMLLGPLVNEFAIRGNPTLILPFEGISRDFVSKFFEAFVPASRRSLVNLFWPNPRGRESKKIPGAQGFQGTFRAFMKRAHSLENQHMDEATLCVIGVDPLLSKKLSESQSQEISRLVGSGSGLVVVIKRTEGRGKPQRIYRIGGARLKLIYYNGTLFLVSESPFSQLFAVTSQTSGGGTRLGIDPMV
jgi:KaiC/GvpD/RAD55 family RecA-like ATPase